MGPAELNCRFGSLELHATIALLHLVLLGRFLYSSPCAPWYLHGLIGGDTVLRVVLRAALGGACSSPTISAMLHAHFATFAVLQIRLCMLACEALVGYALAVHLLRKSEGAAAKLQLLSVTALVHILIVGWWCTYGLTDRIAGAVMLSTFVLGLESLFFCYSVTKSRAIALVNFFIAPAVLMGVATLNASYPADIGNRLLHHPDSALNPHWSVLWRCNIANIIFVASAAAVNHALSKFHCRAALTAPELAAQFSLANLKVAEWLWLSVLVVVVAVMSQNAALKMQWRDLFAALAATITSSKWHVEDICLLSWLLFCAFSLLAIWITSPRASDKSDRATERNRRSASASETPNRPRNEAMRLSHGTIGL